MLRKKDGFSLTELMMVIGIIALLCGVALPAVVNWLPRYKQGSAARDVMAVFENARMLAVKRNSYVLVEQDFGSNTIMVYLCQDDARNCIDPNDQTKVLISGLRTVKKYTLPSGIRLKVPPSSYASLDLDTADKKFINITKPHFRFSKGGVPVTAEFPEGLMRGSVSVSPGDKYEDKLVFVSAGGNVKIKSLNLNDPEILKD